MASEFSQSQPQSLMENITVLDEVIIVPEPPQSGKLLRILESALELQSESAALSASEYCEILAESRHSLARCGRS